MQIPDFCVFVLSHGRANKVRTVNTLDRAGYTGKIILVIDDEDSQGETYRKNFPHVEVFNKAALAQTCEMGDNFIDHEAAVVYARHACFHLAHQLGYTYFLQLDDDYVNFEYRVYAEGRRPIPIQNLDYVFSALLDFYKSTPTMSVSMAQGGDFIGGQENQMAKRPTLFRKCMNSFFCSTKRPFHFVGRGNDDVNTYVHGASIGQLFFTVPYCALVQTQTQSSRGGLTEYYLAHGTYVKSFYSVMYHPSSVTIRPMGETHQRLHHHIVWNDTAPKILHETVRRT